MIGTQKAPCLDASRICIEVSWSRENKSQTSIMCVKCCCRDVEAEGHDLHTLLFQYLDEFLFVFASEMFVPCQIKIKQLSRTSWKVKASGCDSGTDDLERGTIALPSNN